jgi:hypothetical protein
VHRYNIRRRNNNGSHSLQKVPPFARSTRRQNSYKMY